MFNDVVPVDLDSDVTSWNSDMDEIDDLYHNQKTMSKLIEKNYNLPARLRYEIQQLNEKHQNEIMKVSDSQKSLVAETQNYMQQLHSLMEELQLKFSDIKKSIKPHAITSNAEEIVNLKLEVSTLKKLVSLS